MPLDPADESGQTDGPLGPDALAPDEGDVVSVPEGASLETIRVGLLFTQRDLRRVEKKVDRNGQMDEEDRAALVRVEVSVGAAIAGIERLEQKAASDWFDRITGQGDAIDGSKRPLLRLLVLVLAVLVGLGALAAVPLWLWYTSDGQQARRDRREEQVFELQKLAAQAALNTAANARQDARLDSLVAAEPDTSAQAP